MPVETLEYRDSRYGFWKKSYASFNFSDISLINKVVGYEKYRIVVR